MNDHYMAFHKKLIEEQVDAHVVYFDPQIGKKVDQKFDAVATYLLSKDSKCAHFQNDG
jgi:hypothetical protein